MKNLLNTCILKRIHQVLHSHNQSLYMKKLKRLSTSVSQEEVLALLDKAPDIEPSLEDKMPNPFSKAELY